MAGLNVMADHLPSDFCMDSSLLCSVDEMLMLEQTGDLCFSSKESKPFCVAWQQSGGLQVYSKAELKKTNRSNFGFSELPSSFGRSKTTELKVCILCPFNQPC